MLYLINPSVYIDITYEDNVVEWLTFILLVASGILSIIIANGIRKKYRYFHWFFILFSVFTILAGLEEISWGQRVFGVESPEFFKKHSDQKEINLHNTFQEKTRIKTKHIALLVLFIYGVILPLYIKNKRYRFNKMFIVPPPFLIPAFLIATLFMLDFPTEQEEEYGELLYSVAFFVFILYNHQLYKLEEFCNIKPQSDVNKSSN